MKNVSAGHAEHTLNTIFLITLLWLFSHNDIGSRNFSPTIAIMTRTESCFFNTFLAHYLEVVCCYFGSSLMTRYLFLCFFTYFFDDWYESPALCRWRWLECVFRSLVKGTRNWCETVNSVSCKGSKCVVLMITVELLTRPWWCWTLQILQLHLWTGMSTLKIERF